MSARIEAEDAAPVTEADEVLAALVADGWRPGRCGPLVGSLRYPTRNKAQLARAVEKLRLARSVRSHKVRLAYLDWEEALFQLGRRFSVTEWRGRFNRSRKCWERWLRKGRQVLGLSLRFAVEDSGSGENTHWLLLTDEDVERLAVLRYYAEAWYLHGVPSDHTADGVEGLERTAPGRRGVA